MSRVVLGLGGSREIRYYRECRGIISLVMEMERVLMVEMETTVMVLMVVTRVEM
jgi:hypothetical protein